MLRNPWPALTIWAVGLAAHGLAGMLQQLCLVPLRFSSGHAVFLGSGEVHVEGPSTLAIDPVGLACRAAGDAVHGLTALLVVVALTRLVPPMSETDG